MMRKTSKVYAKPHQSQAKITDETFMNISNSGLILILLIFIDFA